MEKAAKRRRLCDGVSGPGEERQSEGEASEPKSPCGSPPALSRVMSQIQIGDLHWNKIKRTNLDLDYTILFPKSVASSLLEALEDQVEYFTGDLARVRCLAMAQLTQKTATYGDPGLTYKYSGVQTPARPWLEPLQHIRDVLARVTGHDYNFVLINRYKDGNDKMGEHKDDEKELDAKVPIASLSLGQERNFYFKHQDSRPPKKFNIEKVQMQLQHGSLLLMNPPTNQFWYHALPPRKASQGVRVNLTFRKVVARLGKTDNST
ncbi:DNA oxidative demethylase ALKBH2 [Chionoecetes opilio]|uniref:DNA oxidative demethylase ALKBH2 n=1 Tax=Chionoecetes opilio TaxID=41210 RepID=A0A8J4YGS9_CHIOP|nr:DNA oxidative demethylase ALKBH2 [Chionoecetes opilio]